MPATLKHAALCLNWILAIVLGCLWYAQRQSIEPIPASAPAQSPVPAKTNIAAQAKTPPVLAEALRARAEAYHKSAELSTTSRDSSKEEGYARSNVLWVPALKDPAYHAKLNRWLKLTRMQNETLLLQILNLPDAKRDALIDLLVNRSLDGIDAQEVASEDPATQRQMRHQVLSDYQSKIVELLGDKFWLYNQCVALSEFQRFTLEPVGNLLEIYGAPFTREQQADLVDWFFSDNKRQRTPYESLTTWAESGRSNLTAQQKQTLGPVLQEFSALNPPKTKKKNENPSVPQSEAP